MPHNYTTATTENGIKYQVSKVSTLNLTGLLSLLTFPTGNVKLSARKLKEDFLPENADVVYHNVTVDGILAGHVFACRWKFNNKQVCWVTQLVVSRDHRNMGLASSLLRSLRTDVDDLYGIMSSHPAAVTATAKAFGCERNIAQGRNSTC